MAGLRALSLVKAIRWAWAPVFACVLVAGCATPVEQAAEETGAEVQTLRVPEQWARSGTMVVFMPEKLAAVKVSQNDQIYMNWAQTLMDYADVSEVIIRVEQVGVLSRSHLRTYADQIPSSEYSLLLVGLRGRALHIPEPLTDIGQYQAAEDFLLGRVGVEALPERFELVQLITPSMELGDEGIPASRQ